MRIAPLAVFLTSLLLSIPLHASPIWQEQPLASRQATDTSRLLTADLTALEQLLLSAPLETQGQSDITVELPLPEGGFISVAVSRSPILSPERQAEFPEFQSFRFSGINNSEYHGRMDITPSGFHAIIFTPDGVTYINPEDATEQLYSSRKKSTGYRQKFSCGAASLSDNDNTLTALNIKTAGTRAQRSFGSRLRTYDLALAATWEYHNIVGRGRITSTYGAMFTAINRVNAIYEKDLGIRLRIISGTNLISTSTSDFTNNDGFEMLAENQSWIDNKVGSGNYDIGHVFSTGGGGIAWLGSVCDSSHKAKGVTGLPNPVGDFFYIDYVAHEIGHQFGATHTFNADGSNTGSCEGNRQDNNGFFGGSAYEPGSGSTIMAYAGICDDQDLQSNSGAYFHTRSIEQIRDFVRGTIPGYPGYHASCNSTELTSDIPPTAEAGSNYTIPALTPFVLSGSASDVDSPEENIHYTWEQMDLGSATASLTAMHTDSGSGPLMRSWEGSADNRRFVPKLDAVLSGNHVANKGERLPTTDRTLNFRLTTRSGKGVATDDMTVTVDADSGPFIATAPVGTASYTGYQIVDVTWNPANTQNSPVNCSTVDITLSDDAGQSFDTVVTAAAANDGSARVNLPNMAVESGKGRLKVSCSDNIFYHIAPAVFSIVPSSYYLSLSGSPATLEGNDGNQQGTFTVTLNSASTSTVTVNYSVSGSGDNPADVNDFGGTLPSGTLTFMPGAELSQQISIDISGDNDFEADESYQLQLSSALNASLAEDSAYGTITNDDIQITLNINGPQQVSEGNDGLTNAQFTVTLNASPASDVTVDYHVTGSGTATADAADFGGELPSGSLSFSTGGNLSQTIDISISGDTDFESDEEFQLSLSSPSGAVIETGTATATITNDDAAPSGSSGSSGGGSSSSWVLLALLSLLAGRQRSIQRC